MRLANTTLSPAGLSYALNRPSRTLAVSIVISFVDPYADTQELPVFNGDSDASVPWEREQIAAHIGTQYQVVRELGRGGMGIVFLARDIALHRLVAIKVLRQEFASSDEHRERFRREARMTARLSHANIVPVHTFGEVDQFTYIVMKYVHGESLAERLRVARALPTEEVRSILHDLALALDYAHREGVVHRDLKPENILLERGTGRPMLTDFGVALQRSLDPVRAEASRAFGTPHYMSPEQAAGELDIDGRSDLYSLGVLGYYMLTGELPFDAPTFEALAAKHVAEAHRPVAELAPLALREHPLLVAALERCLEKDRETRWRHGRDLATAVAQPVRKRWLQRARSSKKAAMNASVVGAKIVAELAMFAAAMRAAFRFTA
jgi:eukaryotic-like serine/threonine-protein kinase